MQHRIALVTGSTSGIGYGIAERFASLGASVVVHGPHEAEAQEVARPLADKGFRVAAVGGDLVDVEACRHIVRFTIEQFGGIDVLVNNAATTSRAYLEDASVEFWDRIDEHQPPRAVRVPAGGHHVDEGPGRRIGRQHRIRECVHRSVEPGPYSVSKGGLMTLTRNAAASLSRYRIRVNQINVGWTLTEGEERVKREEEHDPDWLAEAVATRPFGRLLCHRTSRWPPRTSRPTPARL